MPGTDVAIWEEALTVPTYCVGPAELSPMFYTGRGYQGAKGPIYPYPLLDKLTDVREEKSYRAVYLENRYVKLCVLPEIGGRIFSGLDKTNQYDFIYRQHVIKPALIGMLGAWISGGVEWNIPHHHRPSTFMPADYRLAENLDGSKTLWLGEIELRHRMKWIVGLTLHPGRSCLEVTIRIFNRTPYVHSFLCFTNVAVHVNGDYQVIFPPGTEYGTQHAKCEFVRWPIADGTYAGVDYSAGVDVSWWKNHPSPLSIFAWNHEDDFFGGYDHGRQAGILHVADHHAVPGKKFFTFGSGPAGRMWDNILTDADGPYLELMAGAYSDNQPDYSWIQPYETKTLTQYWYPVRQLGGVKNANRDAAVNLVVDERNVARLAFNATAEFRDAVAVLQAGESNLFQEKVTIGPDKPFVKELPLPHGVKPRHLKAALLSSSKRELISYRPVEPSRRPMPAPVQPPSRPEEIRTNEELYLTGLRLEQFHSSALEPYPYYEEALKRDPGDARANTALAVLYCKRGMFRQAREKLLAAIQRLTRNYTHPKDGESLYYLGVALKAQGHFAAARDALSKAAWSHAWRAAGHYVLAEIALQQGDLTGAMESVEQSLSCNALNTRARNLKTVLLRKAQRPEEAIALAWGTMAIDPLDFWARNERVLAEAGLGRQGRAERELARLTTLMRDEAQSYLELACDYENCGLWDEAIDVLARLLGSTGQAGPADPMVHYALGYYWESKGDEPKASQHYRLGSQMPTDYCFPFRLESVRWLSSAMKNNPADSHAPYYLGNLLFDLQPENAVRAWEESRRLDDTFAIVHRNLALAYARTDSDKARAIASLKRAIECNGQDPRFFAELDQLLEAEGVPARERLSLLEDNHEVVARRDDSLLRRIKLHVLLGQYDRAVRLLEKHHFRVWEGAERAAHDAYVDAHLLKGRGLFAAGRYPKALAEYEAASEYPPHLEFGQPHDGGRAAEVWYLIGTACEALGDGEKARAAFQQAVQKKKMGTYLSYYQGLACRKLGQEAEAATRFDELIQLGRDMLTAGPEADFFQKFSTRRDRPVGKADGHYLLGLGLLGKGDPEAARREFQEALRLRPDHLGAQTMLAELP